MKKIILLGLVAAIASAAMASTTFKGQTGLIEMPTAMSAPAGSFNLAGDFYNYGAGINESVGPNTTFPVRATWGVTDNFEIGAFYLINRKDAGISTKWVTPITFLGTKLALGATADTFGKGSMTSYNAYAALTKKIVTGNTLMLNAHGFVGGSLNGGTTYLYPAVGADVTFPFVDNLNVAAEFFFRGNIFSFKGSLPLGNGFGIQAGLLNKNFFAGVNFDLMK